MKNRRPLIGVTSGFDYEKNLVTINSGYLSAINASGGLGVALPAGMDEVIVDSLFERIDGILLSGGPDVDAKYWGEENLTFGGEISPLRDQCEIYIAREAVKRNMPLLGICRGAQLLNIALGGTIYQDIHSQIIDRIVIKHSQSAPKWYGTHDVFIDKESKIYQIYKRDSISVNSFHHQAVKEVAPGFKITCKSSDGIIEAIEHKENRFTLGVQWHPEVMWEKDNLQLKIFEHFIKSI